MSAAVEQETAAEVPPTVEVTRMLVRRSTVRPNTYLDNQDREWEMVWPIQEKWLSEEERAKVNRCVVCGENISADEPEWIHSEFDPTPGLHAHRLCIKAVKPKEQA